MTSADLKLVNDINNILNNGMKDKDPRPHYNDGTPAHTLFVNHNIRTYHLEKEFPICTLRPIGGMNGNHMMFQELSDKDMVQQYKNII